VLTEQVNALALISSTTKKKKKTYGNIKVSAVAQITVTNQQNRRDRKIYFTITNV
jgi:hypothetical protein